MAESKYQSRVINELETLFPGCVILKNDPLYKQGILDLTILYNDMWATLEVKDSIRSPLQPNQQWWIDTLNDMSFAAMICPQNEAEVLGALQQAFEISRRTCVPEPQ